MGFSLGHLLIILIIVLVLFGAGKLPQMMSDMGKGMKAFKDGIKDEEPKLPVNANIIAQEPKAVKKTPVKAKTTTAKAKTKADTKAKSTTKSKIVATKSPAKKTATTKAPKAKKA